MAQVLPSDTEMEILKRFWRDGDLSARELQARVGDRLNWTPSTTIQQTLITESTELDGSLPAAAFSGSQLLDAADIAELEAVLNRADAEAEDPA